MTVPFALLHYLHCRVQTCLLDAFLRDEENGLASSVDEVSLFYNTII